MEYNRDDYVYVVAINTKLKVIGGISYLLQEMGSSKACHILQECTSTRGWNY